MERLASMSLQSQSSTPVQDMNTTCLESLQRTQGMLLVQVMLNDVTDTNVRGAMSQMRQ